MLLAAGCGRDGGGDAILADASSTVGPFTTRAAENFKQQNADVEVTKTAPDSVLVGDRPQADGWDAVARVEIDGWAADVLTCAH